jgi:F-type H+/Na+-transporting ATPase subunit alpha
VNGYLDDIPVGDVPRFEAELVEHLRADGTILETIRETGDLPDEIAGKLEEEIGKVKQAFAPSESDSLVA